MHQNRFNQAEIATVSKARVAFQGVETLKTFHSPGPREASKVMVGKTRRVVALTHDALARSYSSRGVLRRFESSGARGAKLTEVRAGTADELPRQIAWPGPWSETA